MDARSIAATAVNGGVLTSAFDVDFEENFLPFEYDNKAYSSRVFNGFGKADASIELVYGPYITDIPTIQPLKKNLALKLCSVINDPVTTTDELIPSGETSSFRSNPLRLAEFALSRKDPLYVGASKCVRDGDNADIKSVLSDLNFDFNDTTISSCIFAVKPGDGSAREQAASCQRFRSNLINWGMLPLIDCKTEYKKGDIVVIENIRDTLLQGKSEFNAYLVRGGKKESIVLKIGALTDSEKQIILDGCLINYYKRG